MENNIENNVQTEQNSTQSGSYQTNGGAPKQGMPFMAKFAIILAAVMMVSFIAASIGIAVKGGEWIGNKSREVGSFIIGKGIGRFEVLDQIEKSFDDADYDFDMDPIDLEPIEGLENIDELKNLKNLKALRNLENMTFGFVFDETENIAEFVSDVVEGIVSSDGVASLTGGALAEIWNTQDVEGLEDHSMQKAVDCAGIKSIQLEMIVGGVNVTTADTDKINVDYQCFTDPANKNLQKLSVTEQDDTLLIRQLFKTGYVKNPGLKNRIILNIIVPKSFTGRFELDLVNGRLDVKDISAERMELGLVNGDITASLDDVKSLKVESVNGAVSIGINNPSPEIKIESVNGSIDLGMYGGCDAGYDLSTINGSVKAMGKKSRKSLEGESGNGAGALELSSINGSVTLHE